MRAKRTYGATRNAAHEVHVLVIGESSRRDSWSLYGYPRQTTPHLASLNGEAIFFANALSDANVTVFAVPLLLTGIDPEQFNAQAVRGNLIDLAKEAGYWSGWLANQDAGISFLVGIDANEVSYTKVVAKPAYVVYPPDEVLLAEFDRQLARHDGALFIGMHTYGSHAPYPNRFPEAFAHFSSTPGESPQARSSDQQVLDAYDDAIRYTDWFLGELVNRLRKLGVPATLTYVSDHGEELSALDGRSGHGLGSYSPRAFEIPAFVWMNEAYRSAHPDKIGALAANAGKTIRSHDFFYSVADLMGIKWPGAVPQRSFASPKFTPDTASRYFAAGKLVERTD
jgi:glucan phosphoethanolaminetransferase (alkaline phosphatase superfamily)